MSYEKFILKGRTGVPEISITEYGQIVFNGASLVKFDLEKYSFSTLYYDKENKKIGIKLTNDESDEGKRLIRKRKNYATIGAKLFLLYYNIKLNGTKKVIPTWDEDAQMIVLDVSQS